MYCKNSTVYVQVYDLRPSLYLVSTCMAKKYKLGPRVVAVHISSPAGSVTFLGEGEKLFVLFAHSEKSPHDAGLMYW